MRKAFEGASIAGGQAVLLAVVTYLSVPDNVQWTAATVALLGKLAVTSFCTGLLVYLKPPARSEDARDRATDKLK